MRVSRALNSPQLVRPKTAEKVMQAVADYLLKKGYRRHGLLWTADRRAIGQRVASIVSNKFHVKTILLMSDFTWLNESPHKLPASQNNKEPVMPHVDIKCFPRDLNEEEKDALAADITEVIIRHLQSKESSVSVALNEVEPGEWQSVWDAEIAPQMTRLIKKPGYSM